MSIVAISQTFGSLGDEIARELAETLSYAFADREIILRAANRFGEPVAELEHATEERPTLWDRLRETQRRYLAYVEAAIWELAAWDNVVLLDRGSPIVLREVRHALRVRITAPERLRAKRVELQQGLISGAAVRLVRQSDRERASRVKFLYHVDWDDPLLYDLVLNTERLAVKEAIRLIYLALQHKGCQPTTDSRAEVNDRSRTARAEAALLMNPLTRPFQLFVSSNDGDLTLRGWVRREEERKTAEEIVAKVPGVTRVLNEIGLADTPRTRYAA